MVQADRNFQTFKSARISDYDATCGRGKGPCTSQQARLTCLLGGQQLCSLGETVTAAVHTFFINRTPELNLELWHFLININQQVKWTSAES